MSVFTVFLDRDGVFDVHKLPGVLKVADFDWLPGVKEAFAKLNHPDVQTCLCTNQPMVGHFMATPRMIANVNAHLVAGLHAAGGRMDNVEAAFSPVWFPHRRRKPRPGMLVDGAKKLANPVDKSRAVMIGDTLKDAQAANAYGCQAILLRTTHADIADKAAAAGVTALVMDDLPAAVDWILRQIDQK
jgi:D-glycero-D-manno-heptose 1,7-bisphosphate phosphatase